MNEIAVLSAQKKTRGAKERWYLSKTDISFMAQTKPLSHFMLQITENWRAESSRRNHFIAAFIFDLYDYSSFQE